MKNGYFPSASKLIACPFQSSSFKFLKISQTLLKIIFWKRWRTRNTKPLGTPGQFIDGNSALLCEMWLNNI